VDALAAFRLTRLVAEDVILDEPRDALAARIGEAHPRLSEALYCPWCVGVWLSLGVVVLRRAVPRAWPLLARALALSAVAGLLADLGKDKAS